MMMMSQPQQNLSFDDKKTDGAARLIADLARNMRVVKRGEEAVDLGPNFQPGPMDVICARGKRAFLHPGNKRFRGVIEARVDKYASAANKFEKTVIVSQIVDEVRQASPQGGFVRLENGKWFEVGDNVAREKVGQR